MIVLQKMSQESFDQYLEWAVDHLARELAISRDLCASEALMAAQKSFNHLFPDWRVDSADQHVFEIRSTQEIVGIIHLGVRRDRAKPYAYIWDLMIHPQNRGRGYAEIAMRQIEAVLPGLGCTSLSLNVFGHNAPAIRLYEKLGYMTRSMTMTKEVASEIPTPTN